MRTTVTVDDELLAKARRYSGIDDNGELIRKGLRMIVEWEASRRLAELGGTDPAATIAPRKRPMAA